jgi:uncharacterized membrane protein
MAASSTESTSEGSLPNLWYLGVLLEIVSTMSGTVGKQLIRLAELKRRKNPRCGRIALTVGLIVNTAVGPIVDMGAYSFAAQSLIAPFGGLDVVWNALLAPYILKEKLTRRRVIGCILIVIGTLMAGGFGNHTDHEYTLDYLEDTLINVRVLVYFCVFFAWFLLNRLYLMKKPTGSAIRGISLGCTAGTIAGNMFCVKGAIELIQRSIHEEEGEIWLHWLPYALLAGAVFFALTNVIYMTKGLQEFEALFMVTIYEGSMIVSGCVSGTVVLLDLEDLEHWRVALYALSVVVVVAGMYVIFSEEAKSKSSLMAGTASIERTRDSKPSLVAAATGERSVHASLVPSTLQSPRSLGSPGKLRWGQEQDDLFPSKSAPDVEPSTPSSSHTSPTQQLPCRRADVEALIAAGAAAGAAAGDSDLRPQRSVTAPADLDGSRTPFTTPERAGSGDLGLSSPSSRPPAATVLRTADKDLAADVSGDLRRGRSAGAVPSSSPALARLPVGHRGRPKERARSAQRSGSRPCCFPRGGPCVVMP